RDCAFIVLSRLVLELSRRATGKYGQALFNGCPKSRSASLRLLQNPHLATGETPVLSSSRAFPK
ncbi:MAG: hypothetical protein RI565_08670, partial [Schleiferiaceae bacterium]|nr:hypothetical protein [Schleiferiaceae bacterium]